MAARVFISCGQAIPEERLAAQNISDWLRSQGYQPYVAVNVQTIPELNSGIIGALKESDYYLFIDFPREKLPGTNQYRGSLYTHQELAAAYVLEFSKIILISHESSIDEGIKKFIVSNSPRFKSADEVPELVKKAISASDWTPSFSRHMSASIRWGGECVFRDHTTGSTGRITKVLHGDVRNHRNELPARHTLCRLVEIRTPEGGLESPDRSLLKASGRSGYEHTIWPNSAEPFDLLGIDLQNPGTVFLHSSMDLVPRNPIIRTIGTYMLRFEVCSEGFPIMNFHVTLENTGNPATTLAQVAH